LRISSPVLPKVWIQTSNGWVDFGDDGDGTMT
jgi:hypothetical protein